MNKFRLILPLSLCLLVSGAFAQTTQPAKVDAPLEVRAAQAFNSNQYAVALPLLQKLADGLKDQPERLGPVQEQIRVCQRKLAEAPTGAMAQIPPPPSAESRKAHEPPRPGEVRSLTIPDLGNFQYDAEKGGSIPDDVKALSGSKIRCTGYMIPMDQAEKISQFALVPSLFNCCFGLPPQIQHTIVVTCPKGKSVSYFPDEITVEGTLKVEEKKDDGFIISIFELEPSSVKPAVK
jgi:hypothetical protein